MSWILSDPSADQLPPVVQAPMPGGSVPWRILVGVADRPRPEIPIGIFDVLVRREPAPPGWVSVADVDRTLEAFTLTCASAPLAACTMAQLLRLNEHLSIPEATLSESLAYSMLLAGPEFAVLAGSAPDSHLPARGRAGRGRQRR